jgi:hypothetical protein
MPAQIGRFSRVTSVRVLAIGETLDSPPAGGIPGATSIIGVR